MSKILNLIIFMSLKIVYTCILTKSADPGEMPPYAAFTCVPEG